MHKIAMWTSLLAVALATACASSKSMVTGKSRPSLRPRDVILYTNAPPQFETVGTVVSRAAGHGQSSVNAAMNELRQRAGRVGANGVILDHPENNGAVFVSGFLDRHTRASGKAIFVPVASNNATVPVTKP
ncbi:MAG: hypothetical protein EXS22_03535 [Pedosphaera sp.]|nr:hypothetical protein [Pedosphaera sp.]MSU43098.1 hypothetical protein [Pedosphaera sp.]